MHTGWRAAFDDKHSGQAQSLMILCVCKEGLLGSGNTGE